MAENDDDIFGNDDDVTEDDDTGAAPAAEEVAKPAAKEKPAAPAAPDQSELLQAALGTLKSAWANEAKAAGHAVADFEGIGIKGFDDAAKQAFLAEAKASHEKRVTELQSLGFHYEPERNAADEAARAQAAADAAAKEQWGPTGPGQPATGGEQNASALDDAVKSGDTMAVIRGLKGLGDFVVKGRK